MRLLIVTMGFSDSSNIKFTHTLTLTQTLTQTHGKTHLRSHHFIFHTHFIYVSMILRFLFPSTTTSKKTHTQSQFSA